MTLFAIGLWGACVEVPYRRSGPADLVQGPDADADGFVDAAAGGEDCDDARADVNPEQPEVCGDSVDNNCDGEVDDRGQGAVVLRVDADGDGYGADSGTQVACPGAPGLEARVQLGGDCNDAEPAVHPGVSTDLCDQIDNDCDGRVDEDSPTTRNGEPVESLWHAVTEAPPGDSTIDVCSAVVSTVIEVPIGREITIRGMVGRESAVIESKGYGALFELSSGAWLGLEGLTLRGALTHAIDARGAHSVTLADVVVERSGSSGVRIEATGLGPAYWTINDSLVQLNGATDEDGGGIRVVGQVQLVMNRSTIADNEGHFGGGLYVNAEANAASVSLVDTDLLRNEATEEGGGLYAEGLTVSLSGGSWIGENQAVKGGGASLRVASLEGTGEVVNGNTATDKGGGVSCFESQVSDIVINANTAAEGGGLVVEAQRVNGVYGANQIVDVEVSDNVAQLGAGLFVSPSQLVLEGSSVVRNTAGKAFPVSKILLEGQGGGAYLEFAGRPGVSFQSVGVDWGVLKEDNEPEDIWHDYDGARSARNNESFSCSWVGCTQ